MVRFVMLNGLFCLSICAVLLWVSVWLVFQYEFCNDYFIFPLFIYSVNGIDYVVAGYILGFQNKLDIFVNICGEISNFALNNNQVVLIMIDDVTRKLK